MVTFIPHPLKPAWFFLKTKTQWTYLKWQQYLDVFIGVVVGAAVAAAVATVAIAVIIAARRLEDAVLR